MSSENERALKWIVEGDTGISSKTIWAVMMGVIDKSRKCGHGGDYNIPHDPDDFSRCYELLKLMPEWRSNLSMVGDILPKWKPLIREWNLLTEMYEDSVRRRLDMYDFMVKLIKEGEALEDEIKS